MFAIGGTIVINSIEMEEVIAINSNKHELSTRKMKHSLSRNACHVLYSITRIDFEYVLRQRILQKLKC